MGLSAYLSAFLALSRGLQLENLVAVNALHQGPGDKMKRNCTYSSKHVVHEESNNSVLIGCKVSFHLIGCRVSTCKNGTWKPRLPKCIKLSTECPADGKYNLTKTRNGNVLKYGCGVGPCKGKKFIYCINKDKGRNQCRSDRELNDTTWRSKIEMFDKSQSMNLTKGIFPDATASIPDATSSKSGDLPAARGPTPTTLEADRSAMPIGPPETSAASAGRSSTTTTRRKMELSTAATSKRPSRRSQNVLSPSSAIPISYSVSDSSPSLSFPPSTPAPSSISSPSGKTPRPSIPSLPPSSSFKTPFSPSSPSLSRRASPPSVPLSPSPHTASLSSLLILPFFSPPPPPSTSKEIAISDRGVSENTEDWLWYGVIAAIGTAEIIFLIWVAVKLKQAYCHPEISSSTAAEKC